VTAHARLIIALNERIAAMEEQVKAPAHTVDEGQSARAELSRSAGE